MAVSEVIRSPNDGGSPFPRGSTRTYLNTLASRPISVLVRLSETFAFWIVNPGFLEAFALRCPTPARRASREAGILTGGPASFSHRCLGQGFSLLLPITDAMARGTGQRWETSGVPVGTDTPGTCVPRCRGTELSTLSGTTLTVCRLGLSRNCHSEVSLDGKDGEKIGFDRCPGWEMMIVKGARSPPQLSIVDRRMYPYPYL